MYCTAKCGQASRSDDEYFDGMGRTAIGWDEKECWVTGKKWLKKVNRHHVVGRLSDPKESLLVVLSPGIHDLVTKLSRMLFLADEQKVEDLLTLARYAAGLPDAKTTVRYKET